MKILTTPNIREGRVFVVEDGELVVNDGRLADLIAVDAGGTNVEVYLHPGDAPGFVARYCECGLEKGRLN